LKKISLIGFGAISRLLVMKLAEHDENRAVLIDSILVRADRRESVESDRSHEAVVCTEVNDIIDRSPDIVVECAGQGAVAEYAEPVLSAGIDLMIISTGALVDQELRESLVDAARAAGSKIIMPSGAIAGIDGMGSLRMGGLKEVRYTSIKPPIAWKGTPAENEFDLENISEPEILYSGPASEAARLFPKNANLAATVALAGVGLEKTKVQLIADPGVAPNNVGRIEAEGLFGKMTVECRGMPAPDNPKTSAATAMSLAYSLLKDHETIVL